MNFPIMKPAGFFSIAPIAALAILSVAACSKSSPPPAPDIVSEDGTSMTMQAAADQQRVGDLVISAASTRETALAGVTGVGFLTIHNAGTTDDVLLGATTAAAGSVEIHEMSMTDGVMKMRALADGLPIPAGATVQLASGGIHLMLIDTKAQFKTGETIEVDLRFARAGAAKVRLKVEPL